MEFLVLGPFQVCVDGELIEISAAKPRALLGVLLVNANHVVSTDRLLEDVWGDQQPAGGAKTLQYHISKLRDALEPDRERGAASVIVTEVDGYVLRVEPDEVDANPFEKLASEGAELLADGDPELARKRLDEALPNTRTGPAVSAAGPGSGSASLCAGRGGRADSVRRAGWGGCGAGR